MAKIMGLMVDTKQSEDFDMSTFGEFDAQRKVITLFYETSVPLDSTTLYVLAHELRHAYQYLTGYYSEFWRFSVGIGPKPDISVLEEIERDADDYAVKYLKGRGIRIPTTCKIP